MSAILPLAVNSAIVDTLGESDDYYNPQTGYWYDLYHLTNVTPGVAVTISMTSDNMDTFVGVYNVDSGELVASNDDAGSGTNSLLSFTPTFGDENSYVIYATSYAPRSTGTYTLAAV